MIIERSSTRRYLGLVDWEQVAAKALMMADENSPSMAYLGQDGAVGFAETMAEVQGMPLVLVKEAGGSIELACWVREVDETAPDRLARASSVLGLEFLSA